MESAIFAAQIGSGICMMLSGIMSFGEGKATANDWAMMACFLGIHAILWKLS